MTGTYSVDLLQLLTWLVGALGTVIIAMSSFIATRVLGKQEEMMRKQDEAAKSIAQQFEAITRKIDAEISSLRELWHSIDKRVMRLEDRAGIPRGGSEGD